MIGYERFNDHDLISWVTNSYLEVYRLMGFYSSEQAMSSNDDTWTTPKQFFIDLDKEFNFTLDAAALKSSALCDVWYGPDHSDPAMQDAFKRDWHIDSNGGAIWLNPPYGKTIKDWVRKADNEAQQGATVVCLVPSRTDTSWFHNHCIKYEVRYIRGRLKFGDSKNAAPFPSAVVVMRVADPTN